MEKNGFFPSNLTTDEVLNELNTTDKGLTSSEATARLKTYGKNILEEKEKISPIIILLEQFNSPVVWILLGALVISFILGEKVDAIVILAILIINAILGFIQEYNAAKEIDALKKLSSLKALAIRDGKAKEIDSSEVVPGDTLIIREGDNIMQRLSVLAASDLNGKTMAVNIYRMKCTLNYSDVMTKLSLAIYLLSQN